MYVYKNITNVVKSPPPDHDAPCVSQARQFANLPEMCRDYAIRPPPLISCFVILRLIHEVHRCYI